MVDMVDMVGVGVPRRNGSTLSFIENAEEVMVVLRNLRSEFCVFGGERVIDERGNLKRE